MDEKTGEEKIDSENITVWTENDIDELKIAKDEVGLNETPKKLKSNFTTREEFKCENIIVLSEEGFEKYQEKSILTLEIEKCISSKNCTFQVTGKNSWNQTMYHCEECEIWTFLCESCAKICHSGHKGVKKSEKTGKDVDNYLFRCVCGDPNEKYHEKCSCIKNEYKHTIDISKYIDEVPIPTILSYTGKGRYYFQSGAYYIGDWVNGKMHGKGVMFSPTNYRYEMYEGDFFENHLQGYGIWHLSDSARYEGFLVDGKATGKGSFILKENLVYEGEWFDGWRHGFGSKILYNNYDNFQIYAKYDGEINKEKYDGKGIYYHYDEEKKEFYKRYEGEFLDDFYHGKGTTYSNNGETVEYEGEFQRGSRHGFGKYRGSNGERYEGYWEKGNQEGEGKWFYSKTGELLYEGMFKKGFFCGQGKKYYQNGCTYEGEFEKDVRSGNGKFYRKDGLLHYEGSFKDDLYSGQGILYYYDDETKKRKDEKLKQQQQQGEKEEEEEEEEEEGEGEKKEEKRIMTEKIVGGFLKGYVHGKAIHFRTKDDGKTFLKGYDGEWFENSMQGHGVRYHVDGETIRYDGEWKNSKKHGENCKVYHDDGTLYYKGSIIDGKVSGFGEWRGKTGAKYVGHWKDNKRNGKGKSYSDYGNVMYKGEYVMDSYKGIGKRYYYYQSSYGKLNNNREILSSLFEGEFSNDVPDGKGTKIQIHKKYNFMVTEGEWEKDENRKKHISFIHFRFRNKKSVIDESPRAFSSHFPYSIRSNNFQFFSETRKVLKDMSDQKMFFEYEEEKEFEVNAIRTYIFDDKREKEKNLRVVIHECDREFYEQYPEDDQPYSVEVMKSIYQKMKKIMVLEVFEDKNDVEERIQFLFNQEQYCDDNKEQKTFTEIQLVNMKLEHVLKLLL